MLENGRSGTDVVLLSIAYIHQVAIFQDDNNLLRRIAFVETKDGSYLDEGNSGGIWAVDEDTFLNLPTYIFYYGVMDAMIVACPPPAFAFMLLL